MVLIALERGTGVCNLFYLAEIILFDNLNNLVTLLFNQLKLICSFYWENIALDEENAPGFRLMKKIFKKSNYRSATIKSGTFL